MERYSSLAAFYDALSSDDDYEQWVACVLSLYGALRPGVAAANVLDLGCGTGRASLVLARGGSRVTGVDASREMLAVAAKRLAGIAPAPLLLRQDARELSVGASCFDLAMSLCDTVNYLASEDDMYLAFSGVAGSLVSDGVFVFDLSTAYKLATVYGDNTYIEEGPDFFIAWENTWRPRKRICNMRLNLFMADDAGRWRRATEMHSQRAHSHAEIVAALRKAGFTRIEGPYAAFDLTEPRPVTERVFYAAQKA